MLSILTAEGWRCVVPSDILAIYRGNDEPRGDYVSAVLVMDGSEELAGIVSSADLAHVEAVIAEDIPTAA
jgi:hypothetical protein